MNKSDKEALAKKFVELLEQWESNPARMKDGLSYEKTFIDMMQNFEQEVFQKSVGNLPHDKNLKKK